MNRLWPALLPELRQFPAVEQDGVLRQARDAALEPLELIGIAIWLVLVTALTKYILVQTASATDVSATLAVNLVVTVPLLVAAFVPIHIRRLRRGLRKQLDQRDRP
jgi:hypothetical protein